MLQGWQKNFNLGIVLVMKKWNAWSAGGMHVCCNSEDMWPVKVMNFSYQYTSCRIVQPTE